MSLRQQPKILGIAPSYLITVDIYTHADIDMQAEAVKAFEDSMSGL